MAAMRALKDNTSDSMYRAFTNTEKGKIMGFCGVTKWCNVPKIWHNIEGAKSDEDLKHILQTAWGKFETDLNRLF